MPRLWNDTIEEHRRSVRDAVVDAVAALVAERGLSSVTMSRVAEDAGVSRATLYKYFPHVESILLAWHERQIDDHLDHLARVRDETPPPQRLAAVLTAYAVVAYESRRHHGSDLAALLHRDEQVARGERRLTALLRDVLAEAAMAGGVRDDVAPEELARYALHALTAAGALPSRGAVTRLVEVTLAGLRPG